MVFSNIEVLQRHDMEEPGREPCGYRGKTGSSCFFFPRHRYSRPFRKWPLLLLQRLFPSPATQWIP